MSGPMPIYYEYENQIDVHNQPSWLHVSNTGLAAYFRRSFFERALSRWQFTQPIGWGDWYLPTVLFSVGYAAVFEDPRFGVIPQVCSAYGYNVFYRPSDVIIANPLFDGVKELRIGRDCEIITFREDWHGILDIVAYYGDMMALCAETLVTNLYNSKLAYVIGVNGKGLAETFKSMYDNIASGKPAVAVSNKMFLSDGTPAWTTFAQNLKQNYIVTDLLDAMQTLENRFDSSVGINNTNRDKRERLTDDEVNANNEQVYLKAKSWLDTMQRCCERINARYDIGLWVEFAQTPSVKAVTDEWGCGR